PRVRRRPERCRFSRESAIRAGHGSGSSSRIRTPMAAPTIYDIAARANVGIATVSRVINGSRRVSDKTRKAVQKAMSELGFRPNYAARRLAAGVPNRPRIVALMPFFTTAFYFTVCKALSQKLSAADMDLV